MPSRRTILKASAAGLVTAGAAGYAVYQSPLMRPLGANADIRIGIAGLRGKGLDHLNHFLEIRGCRIVALCDPDSEVLAAAAKVATDAGATPTTFGDYRKFVASKDIDAIVIASPNHWHALMALWALENGKHIYCEKPLTHNIEEGRILVEAAAKSGLVAQAGTQFRSDEGIAAAIQYIQEENLGPLSHIRCVSYKQRKRLPKRKDEPVPSTVDYDHWCGPAPVAALRRRKLHYDWHWFWDTGNGDMGNLGIHDLDIARWCLGIEDTPPRVLSLGGRFAFDDFGETPNTQLTLFDYPTPIIHEVRNLPMKPDVQAMDHYKGLRGLPGCVFHCENGYIAGNRAYDNDGKKIEKFNQRGGHGHRVNWLKSITDNRPQDVAAPLAGAHLSTALCHLANISYRLGQSTPPDQTREQLQSNPAALGTFDTLQKHLALHSADFAKLHLGPPVEYNSTTNAITPDTGAPLLTRTYRKPYALPS